jgi:hypothetical protein
MTIKISQLGNLTAFTGNTIFPVVDTANAYITVKSTGSTLLTYIAGNITTLSKNITVTGNITATQYFLGNGSQLAGMNQFSNVQVATYLPSYSGAVQASNIYTSVATITSNVGIALNVAGSANIGGNITCTVMSATAVATNLYNEASNYVNVANTWVYTTSSSITNNILLIFTSNPTATVNMPTTAVDGQVWRLSANANVVLAQGSGTVSPTFAGANLLVAPLRYVYSAQYARWFRS